jgi:epoxyqueuosine reductase
MQAREEQTLTAGTDSATQGRRADPAALLEQVRVWARALGFSQIGVAGIDLTSAEPGLLAWLEAGFHGGMAYMARHGLKRARPGELVPGTLSVISARMDYLPRDAPPDWALRERTRLGEPGQAVVSVYARGRDYHKVLRQRLQTLADRIAAQVGPFGHRVFTDSAPVLEVELATRSGLGWRGKHTLALERSAGSMFFLGEVYTDLPLPPSAPVSAHCGTCSACIDACPTGAIVGPYRLDARRCISYLTIEHEGAIPLEWRAAIGNRVYGCDDCQLVCPWNRYAQRSPLPDFDARAGLGAGTLLELWAWDEAQWLRRTEGSAIRRIGWARWQRNLAVALGNARRAAGPGRSRVEIEDALRRARPTAGDLVREHIDWALGA